MLLGVFGKKSESDDSYYTLSLEDFTDIFKNERLPNNFSKPKEEVGVFTIEPMKKRITKVWEQEQM